MTREIIAELKLPGVTPFDGGAEARRRAVIAVVRFAQDLALVFKGSGFGSDNAAEDLRLVLEELLTNVVRHAFLDLSAAAGRCLVAIDRTAGSVCIELEDNGPAFNPFDAGNPPGCGLSLVRALARSYSWDFHAGQKNRLKLQLPLG